MKVDGIGWTSKGLILLLSGLALGWIPYIQFPSIFLFAAGTILVVLGRKSLNFDHEWYVDIAIILWIFSIIAILITGVYYLSSTSHTIYDSSTFIVMLKTIMIMFVIVSLVSGTGVVLMAYGLSNEEGKKILISGLVIYFAVSIAIFLEVTSAAFASTRSIGYNDIAMKVALNTFYGYHLLDAVPFIVFAFAFYLAKNRVDRDLVPKNE